MECKVFLYVNIQNAQKCIDLTRMECKVGFSVLLNRVLKSIDLTRMECKAIFSTRSFVSYEYRFNQNGM